jgi:hypothetical protein
MRPPALLLVAVSVLVAVPLAAAATAHTTAGPAATTDDPTAITATSAQLNGHATLTCSGTRGFKIAAGTHSSQIASSAGAGSGAFSTSATNLTPGTAYAVYAFASDCAGSAAGSPVEFTTLARLAITISGAGKVTTGTTCTSSCTVDVTNDKLLTITATPNPGYRFAGWAGLCTG